jgi:hypothetical protein
MEAQRRNGFFHGGGGKIVVFQSLPNMIRAIRFTKGKLYCGNGSRWSARTDPMFFEVPLIKYKKLIIRARAAYYLLRPPVSIFK